MLRAPQHRPRHHKSEPAASQEEDVPGGRKQDTITAVITGASAVLFDMDGTLIDSTTNSHRCWSQWADLRGLTDRTFQQWYECIPARQILEALVPAGEVEAALAEIINIEATNTEGITAFSGVPELLSLIPDEQKAIVTSSVQAVALARLEAAGITPPSVLITAEQTQRGKPHPDPFLRAAERLNVDVQSVVVFEDTRAGVQAAKEAGAFVIAIEGTREAADLREADLVVTGIAAIRVRAADRALQFYLTTDDAHRNT
jgi:mannitol-1-/sugar-/sorbitol-6-phosphatase